MMQTSTGPAGREQITSRERSSDADRYVDMRKPEMTKAASGLPRAAFSARLR
jgi:hypothetical protein